MFERASEYIKERLIKGKHIPYIDILVKQNHKTIYRYMDGFEYQPTGKELLYLYSCTKPITAVCAMRLIQEGKMSLEDDIALYLPEYENVFLLDENYSRIKPKNRIKIKHLLTMTAGLTYDRETDGIKRVLKQTAGKANTRQMVAAFVETPLAFEPGSRFLYSLCLDVLAAVIEVVSGMFFADYVADVVLKPLNMLNSGFDEKQFNDVITSCYTYKNGVYETENLFHLMKLSENYESGGGGLIGTVEDYAEFADALACDGVSSEGYRLLDAETIDIMTTNQVGKLSINNKFTCIQGDDYGYGYGVRTRIKESIYGVPCGEFGWDGAAGSYVLIDRKNHISITIGMNLLDWPNIFGGEHMVLTELIYQSIFTK